MLNVLSKRIVLIMSVILIATVLLLPVFSGWVVKKRYEQLTELVLDTKGINLSTVKYEQGWLTSAIETFITFDDPKLVHSFRNTRIDFEPVRDAAVGFLIRHKIFHGPVIHDPYSEAGVHWGQALIYSTAILAKQENGEIKPLLEARELGRARTTLLIDGSGNSRIESVAFETGKSASEKVIWKGLRADWHFTGSFLKSDFTLSAPGLEIISNDFSLLLKKLHIDTNRSHDVDAVWVGEGAIALESFELGDGKKPVLAINDLKVVMDNALRNNELLDTALHIVFSKLLVDDNVFGSGKLEGSLRNMDVLALSQIHSVVRAVKEGKKVSTHKHPIAEEAIRRLPEILENKPELEIVLADMMTAHGKVDAEVQISLGGGNEASHHSPALHVLETLDANIHFSMPKAFMLLLVGHAIRDEVALQNLDQSVTAEAFKKLLHEAAAERLANLETENLVVVRGDRVEFKADIKNEKLMINGKRKLWPF